ncbi:hypothetical protein IAU59_005485 [Kwoniella sp. CBS 9459]
MFSPEQPGSSSSSPSKAVSSSSSSELPYPTFPSSSKTDRLSYATTSPPTPDPTDLFFKPPRSSPRTPPVRALENEREHEPMPGHGRSDRKGKGKESTSAGKKAKSQKSRLSRMMDSPDTGDYMAQLPAGNDVLASGSGGGHGPGVFVGTGLDARSLADMLSPPDARSLSSRTKKKKGKGKEKVRSKGKEKEKAKAKASADDGERGSLFRTRDAAAVDDRPLHITSSPPVTPPPVPPKSSRTTPRSTRTTATTFTDLSMTATRSRSSHTHSTETDFHSTSPQQAVYGQMASASSHHILGKPSLQSLMQAQQAVKYQHIPLKSGESGTTGTGTGAGAGGTLTAGPTTSTSTMTFSPDISESMDHYRRDSFTLEGALAALPWAEPPPRDPTLPPVPGNIHPFANPSSGHEGPRSSSSPAMLSSTFHSEPGTARTPTYSFLTLDPAAPTSASFRSPLSYGSAQPNDHSRRSSRVPSVPQSPSIAHSHPDEAGPEQRRYSAQSGYSGMADQPTPTQTSTSDLANSNSATSQREGHDQHTHKSSLSTSIGEGMSFGSGIATQGSTYSDAVAHNHSKGKKSWSNWSFGGSKFGSRSKSPASDRTKSIRSTRSTRSTKSKRASNSTLAHGQSAGYGGNGKIGTRGGDGSGCGGGGGGGGGGGWKWEIRRYEELDDEGDDGDGREIVRSKEEMMELATLVGRAAVLERMLRSGKRVSSQSVRQLLRSFTPSSHASPLPPLPTHRPSLSLTVSSPSASFSITSNINGDIKSIRPASKRSSYSNSTHHSACHSVSPHTPIGGTHSPRSHAKRSRTRRQSSPASIVAVGISQGMGPAGIRERLRRRLERSESREDIFTEIGSSQGHEEDEAHDGSDWVGEEIMLLPTRETQGHGTVPQKHSTRCHNSRHETKRSTGSCRRELSNSEGRIGGKGVIVFPEETASFGADKSHQPRKGGHSVSQAKARGPIPPEAARIKGGGTHRRSMINCTSPSGSGMLGNCIDKVLVDHNGIPTYSTQPSFDPTQAYGEPVCDTSIDLEKGMGIGRSTSDQLPPQPLVPRYDSKGRPYYPQSPHLGHRSPNWRSRQSVLSYISANGWQDDPVHDRESVRRKKWRWKVGLGVGSGLIVILIIGLLVGLLVKRDETGMSV